MKTKQYLKQYTCYEHLQSVSLLPHKSLRLTPNNRHFQQQPPCVIVDTHLPKPKMYLVKWVFGKEVGLLLKELNEDKQVGFAINVKPMYVDVINNHLYVMGGNEVYVVNLQTMNDAWHTLQAGEVVEVVPGMLDSEVVGLTVYLWKSALTKQQFGQGVTRASQLWSGLGKTLGLIPASLPNKHLKVLVPNILGMMIFEGEVQLVDLTNMQLKGRRYSLGCVKDARKVQIKWRENIKSGQDDSSLLICLGQDTSMQIWILHTKYRQEIKTTIMQQHYTDDVPSIPSFTNSSIIDWNSIHLLPHCNLQLDAPLLDYVLLDEGLIYICGDKINSAIFASYVEYNQPLHTCPILTLQHNIYRQYLLDQHNPSIHRLFVPNRYSLPFVLSSCGVETSQALTEQQIQSDKMICQWHTKYRIRKIVIFADEVLIIRENSITSLLPISSVQFEEEKHTGRLRFSDRESKMSISSFGGMEGSQPNTYDLFHYERVLDEESSPDVWITHFINCLEKKPSNPRNTLKQQYFTRDILTARVKDIILFFEHMTKKNYFTSAQTSTGGENSEVQRLIIHYLSGFRKMLEHAHQQINQLGMDLISLFIWQEYGERNYGPESRVNVEEEVWAILQTLFYDIVPLSIYSAHKQQENKFIRFMIKKTREGFVQANQILYQMFHVKNQNIPCYYSFSILCAQYSFAEEFSVDINNYLLRMLLHVKHESPMGIHNFIKEMQHSSIRMRDRSGIKATILKLGLFVNENYDMEGEEDKNFSDSFRHINESQLEYEIVKSLANEIDESYVSHQSHPPKEKFLKMAPEQVKKHFYRLENDTNLSLSYLLDGWALYFEYYADKLQQLMEKPATQMCPADKTLCLQYLKKCEKSLNNYGQYYGRMYNNRKKEQEYLAVNLHARLVLGKLLTRSWIKTLTVVLQKQDYQFYSTAKNILFSHLCDIFSRIEGREDILSYLHNLHHHFSKYEMSELILENSYLRNNYEQLPNRTKAFFDYTEINTLNYSMGLVNELNYRSAEMESCYE